MISVSYGNIYVGQIALGANDGQSVKAIIEAEAYDGPSLILAYSHCIAHGINMTEAMSNQKAAVTSGHWPLFRFNPDLEAKGENPFLLDSKAPTISFEDFAYKENRFKMLAKAKPERAKMLLELAQQDVDTKWKKYEAMKNSFEK